MELQQQQESIPIDEECQKIQEYFDGTATAVGIHSYRRGMSKDSGIF